MLICYHKHFKTAIPRCKTVGLNEAVKEFLYKLGKERRSNGRRSFPKMLFNIDFVSFIGVKGVGQRHILGRGGKLRLVGGNDFICLFAAVF